jgi:hypothetical protein
MAMQVSLRSVLVQVPPGAIFFAADALEDHKGRLGLL